jgi:hypothetical protein
MLKFVLGSLSAFQFSAFQHFSTPWRILSNEGPRNLCPGAVIMGNRAFCLITDMLTAPLAIL